MSDYKIDWMLGELVQDGFTIERAGVEDILSGNTKNHDAAVVDYVEALEREWQQ